MGQTFGHFVKMKRKDLIQWKCGNGEGWKKFDCTDRKTNVEMLQMLEEKLSI